jgi:hypothetical protein
MRHLHLKPVTDRGDLLVNATVKSTRIARLLPVLTVAGAVTALSAVLKVTNPVSNPLFLACPSQLLLGVDCPGCGGLRGTHALLNGDFARAADYNVALYLVIPVLLIALGMWAYMRWNTRSRVLSPFMRRGVTYGIAVFVVLLLIFGMVRNFDPFLGAQLIGIN